MNGANDPIMGTTETRKPEQYYNQPIGNPGNLCPLNFFLDSNSWNGDLNDIEFDRVFDEDDETTTECVTSDRVEELE